MMESFEIKHNPLTHYPITHYSITHQSTNAYSIKHILYHQSTTHATQNPTTHYCNQIITIHKSSYTHAFTNCSYKILMSTNPTHTATFESIEV